VRHTSSPIWAVTSYGPRRVPGASAIADAFYVIGSAQTAGPPSRVVAAADGTLTFDTLQVQALWLPHFSPNTLRVGAGSEQMRHAPNGNCFRRAIVAGAVAVALFVVSAAPRLSAQSTAGSPGTPNLTGIWHRKGPLNGKPNQPPVPTNRAAGFNQAFDDASATSTRFAFGAA
jgi:hypothetical protein